MSRAVGYKFVSVSMIHFDFRSVNHLRHSPVNFLELYKTKRRCSLIILWIVLLVILGTVSAASSFLSEPQRPNNPAFPEAGAAIASDSQRRFEIFMLAMAFFVLIQDSFLIQLISLNGIISMKLFEISIFVKERKPL